MLGLAIVVSLWVANTASSQTKQDVGRRLAEFAFQMSDKSDRGIEERYRDVFSMINSPTFKNTNPTPAVQQAEVENLGATYPEYSFIGIADPTGKVVASKSNLLLGASVAARPWFQHALTAKQGTLVVEDVHQALLLAKLLPANPSGDPLRFIDIAGPLYNNKNQLYGVFGIHLSFNWIDDIRSALIKPAEQRENVEILVLGKDNQVLLGPESLEGKTLNLKASKLAAKGANGTTQEVWPDGKTYVTGYYGSNGYKAYQGLGWKVLARQPVTTAYASANAEARNIRLSGLTMGLVATTVASILIARVLKREQELENAQREFVSVASHQLRTPVAGINWYVELLEAEKLTQEQKDYVRQISDTNSHMSDLVNSLLDVSRLDLNKLPNKPVPTSITDTVVSLEQELRAGIKHKDITLVVDIPKSVKRIKVEPRLLRMVLQNLMSNAVKYTPQNGSVNVKVEHITRPFDGTRIHITDTGYGIPREDQDKIFSKLYRATNVRKMDVEGTGLGLYIVREVVRKLHGHIGFTSVEDKGTTFIVELPYNTPPSEG